MPTFRIFPISIAISRPPGTRCGGGHATTEGRTLLSPDRPANPGDDLLFGARQIGRRRELRRRVLEPGAGEDQHDLGVAGDLAAGLAPRERATGRGASWIAVSPTATAPPPVSRRSRSIWRPAKGEGTRSPAAWVVG